MKKAQWVLASGMVLLLSGCSSASRIAPWNWFGSTVTITEQGVGKLTANTPLTEAAIAEGLNNDYRLIGGMRIVSGQPVTYYEALKEDKTALLIRGEDGKVSHIEVMDSDIETDSGVKIGTLFSKLYSKAYGACRPGEELDVRSVECSAPGSEHLNYQFSGDWRGPQGLIPPDDVLSDWAIRKIIWHR
ncbi:RpoE-regulated lipoprotein [Enterobacteriaceae bacterium YMB-R22]|jgi:hypothetical protein|uniref:RpoE-regulated lipoprotein n=1 Tax=Tenebrionicola larvae TaxID=2815733 RepID=UPI002011E731|nr:RpoE-regulated lipoprotein [Tenebrionicola larvae]MBV4411806.1 RpoE-regulated lipoprotein [Tenebrionicola larvae]